MKIFPIYSLHFNSEWWHFTKGESSFFFFLSHWLMYPSSLSTLITRLWRHFRSHPPQWGQGHCTTHLKLYQPWATITSLTASLFSFQNYCQSTYHNVPRCTLKVTLATRSHAPPLSNDATTSRSGKWFNTYVIQFHEDHIGIYSMTIFCYRHYDSEQTCDYVLYLSLKCVWICHEPGFWPWLLSKCLSFFNYL